MRFWGHSVKIEMEDPEEDILGSNHEENDAGDSLKKKKKKVLKAPMWKFWEKSPRFWGRSRHPPFPPLRPPLPVPGAALSQSSNRLPPRIFNDPPPVPPPTSFWGPRVDPLRSVPASTSRFNCFVPT